MDSPLALVLLPGSNNLPLRLFSKIQYRYQMLAMEFPLSTHLEASFLKVQLPNLILPKTAASSYTDLPTYRNLNLCIGAAPEHTALYRLYLEGCPCKPNKKAERVLGQLFKDLLILQVTKIAIQLVIHTSAHLCHPAIVDVQMLISQKVRSILVISTSST